MCSQLQYTLNHFKIRKILISHFTYHYMGLCDTAFVTFIKKIDGYPGYLQISKYELEN